MPNPTHSLLATARAWLRDGRRVAVAVVIETWGSSPRPAGSLLVVDHRGAFEGSVSGGCIEAEVVSEALDVLEDGAPRTLDYGIGDDTARAAGLACGGRLRVHVRVLEDPAVVDELLRGPPAALVFRLADPGQAVVRGDSGTGSLDLTPREDTALAAAVAAGHSGLLAAPAGDAFALVVTPPLRLLIVGAVHITQSLVPMAAQVGFAVTVVDPRPAFAAPRRLPGAEIRQVATGPGIAGLVPDERTAVVCLTHDPELDDPALAAALASPAFYIGALGSRRSHAGRLERLRRRGFDDGALARIQGPVGLDLGGRQPEEIALAISAELVAARYGRVPARP
ncbi:MAG: XdhC family protein [Gammaproteobacteria bacterium]|nr:XdhC family protein [Gammaproteobacteria bacterium]